MMQNISFNITEHEVKAKSSITLNRNQIEKVLKYIENDSVLWDAIDQAIESAVQETLENVRF